MENVTQNAVNQAKDDLIKNAKKMSEMTSEEKKLLPKAVFFAEASQKNGSVMTRYSVKVNVTSILSATFYLDETTFKLMLLDRGLDVDFMGTLSNKSCYCRVVKYTKEESVWYQLEVILSKNVTLRKTLKKTEIPALLATIDQITLFERSGDPEEIDDDSPII